MKPFKLVQDVTILATPEAQKLLANDDDHDQRERELPGVRRQGVLRAAVDSGTVDAAAIATGSPSTRMTFDIHDNPANWPHDPYR